MRSLTDQIREILDLEDPSPGEPVTHEASFDIESSTFEPGGHQRTAQVAVIIAGPPSMGMASVIAEILARHPELVDIPVVLDHSQIERLAEDYPLLRDHDGDHPAPIEKICRDQLAVAEANRRGMVLVLDDDVRQRALESMARSVAAVEPCRADFRSRFRDWEGRDPCRNKHLRKQRSGKGNQGRAR